MDPVTGAVIIAGLTTVGKPTAETLTAIFGKLLSPAADAVGQGIAAPLQAWAKRRGERASNTLIEAAQVLDEASIEPERVPEKLLLPILEHSSVEEEPTMQQAWIALLANAATPDNRVIPAFASILNQLTPVQAKMLQWMYAQKVDNGPTLLPTWPDFERAAIESTFGLSPADYALLITDMERLQLIEPRRDITKAELNDVIDGDHMFHLIVARWNSRIKYDFVGFTALGLRFIEACTPPRASE